MCQKCGENNRISRDGQCINDNYQVQATEDVDRIWDHDSVAFQLPSGIGKGHQVEISVSGQTDDTRKFDYEPPSIDILAPQTGPTIGYTTQNEYTIKIKGNNFGDHDAQVHMGTGDECEGDNSQIFGPDVCLYRCEIVNQDHEEIEIKLPAGIGFNIPVRVKVGGQVSNMDVLFNYSIPMIHAVFPLGGRTDGKTQQRPPKDQRTDENNAEIHPEEQIITIYGENFGSFHKDYQRNRTLRIGTSIFFGLPVSANDTVLEFNLPTGTGLNHTVDIEVAGQKSTTKDNNRFVFNYDKPLVYPIKVFNWTRQSGNTNFPAENGNYYAPTTGCANPAGQMDEVLDPEAPPKKRGCIGAAHIIIKGENFGCCTHS